MAPKNTRLRRILIVSLNYGPEMVGIGKYNQSMAEELVDRGISTTVLCSQAYFPVWRFFDPRPGVVVHRGLTEVRVSPLILTRGRRITALTRIVFEASFLMKALPRLLTLLLVRRPDLVFFTSPPLFASFFLNLLARTLGFATHFHHQDLQLEASQVVMGTQTGLLKVLSSVDRASLRSFTGLSTISEGMRGQMVRKTRRPVHIVPNWADEAVFALTPDLDRKFASPRVVYSGSIGEKQGLEVAILAARDLEDLGLQLHIYGQGANRSVLEEYAVANKVVNVWFHDLLPSDEFLSSLNESFLQLIIQKEEIQESVLPSKMNNIVASGTPMVVAATPTTYIGSLVAGQQLGLIFPPGQAKNLAEQVRRLRGDRVLYNAISGRQRVYAEQWLRRNSCLDRLLSLYQYGGLA